MWQKRPFEKDYGIERLDCVAKSFIRLRRINIGNIE